MMAFARRRPVIVAVCVGVVVGLVLAWLALTTEVRRFPLGIAAGDRDEAVMLSRYSDYADSRSFVDLIGPSASKWSLDTTPIFARDIDGVTWASVAGEAVLMLGVDKDDQLWLGSFARADGSVKWWTPLGPTVIDRVGPTVLVDAERAYVVSNRIAAVGLADGKVQWTHVASSPQVDARFVAGRLWVTPPGGKAEALELATGKVTRTIDLDSLLCASPRGLLGTRGKVARWEPFAGVPVELALGDARFAFTNTCGFRGDDVVLTFLRATSWSVARVSLATGQPLWEQVLGPGPLAVEPLVTAATFPQVMPVVVCNIVPYPGWCEATMVDLDKGVVLSHRRTGRVQESIVPIVDGERAWWWLPTFELLIDVGADGKLGASRRFDGLGVRSLSLDDLRDGKLWLAGSGAAHPGEVPWIAYDLRGGAPLGQSGDVTIEDGAGLVEQVLH